jgi:hypothetical protein
MAKIRLTMQVEVIYDDVQMLDPTQKLQEKAIADLQWSLSHCQLSHGGEPVVTIGKMELADRDGRWFDLAPKTAERRVSNERRVNGKRTVIA